MISASHWTRICNKRTTTKNFRAVWHRRILFLRDPLLLHFIQLYDSLQILSAFSFCEQLTIHLIPSPSFPLVLTLPSLLQEWPLVFYSVSPRRPHIRLLHIGKSQHELFVEDHVAMFFWPWQTNRRTNFFAEPSYSRGNWTISYLFEKYCR